MDLTGLVTNSNLNLYTWVQQAFAAFVSFSGRIFFVNACPSSGKTIMGCLMAKHYLRGDKSRKVIIVAPKTRIVGQWQETALDDFGMIFVTDHDWRNRELRADAHGAVITYQALASKHEQIRKFCHYNDVTVFFDEVHHLEKCAAWGRTAINAFGGYDEDGPAKKIISLTGTPFRSNRSFIHFAHYHEKGSDGLSRCKPDFTYRYGQGVAEGICRPVKFRLIDGEMRWHSMGDDHIANFQTTLDEIESRRRLNTALDSDSNWILELLREVVKQLKLTRLTDPDALSLVIARDIKHAECIVKHLEDIDRALRIELVHNEVTNADGILSNISKSIIQPDVIVSVAMVTEGVNIKRTRVIGYCTNVLTESAVSQAWNRGTRREGKVHSEEWENNKTCFIFAPKDPELERQSLQMYKESVDAARFKEGRTQEGGGDPPRPSDFLPQGAEVRGHSVVYDDVLYGTREIERAQSFITNGAWGDLTEVEVLQKLRTMLGPVVEDLDLETQPASEPASEPTDDQFVADPRYHENRKRLKKNCNAMAVKLGVHLFGDDPKNANKIHTLWMRANSGLPQPDATNEELDRKLKWMLDRLENLNWTSEERQVMSNIRSTWR